ncbi:hypothetical protein CTAM01_09171 [Colletotrichum tamarilloi]|uniref:Uncharacterized protein n=1 Tax=Colletotrichum tamarilloi TaxID=1209934 RepID=A0ABQ9R3V0_9PEZI|nr:uncharacterized protein CTAM01_09171 [Colletotrichum tamarilloi]KAK1493980.1 hypothetical protein CTAM01_09171 [Colletotrichum tamarilloi]
MGLSGSCGWAARVSPRRGLQAPTARKGDETPATLLSLSPSLARQGSALQTPQLARACDWRVSAKAVSWPASNLSADVYPPSSAPRFASSHCSHSQEDVDGADGGGGGAAAAAATRGFVPSCAVLRCALPPCAFAQFAAVLYSLVSAP